MFKFEYLCKSLDFDSVGLGWVLKSAFQKSPKWFCCWPWHQVLHSRILDCDLSSFHRHFPGEESGWMIDQWDDVRKALVCEIPTLWQELCQRFSVHYLVKFWLLFCKTGNTIPIWEMRKLHCRGFKLPICYVPVWIKNVSTYWMGHGPWM